MNPAQLKAAKEKWLKIKESSNASEVEMADALKNDAAKYSAADQTKILKHLFPAASGSGGTGGAPSKKDLPSANAEIADKLEAFDYGALKGKTFRDYVALVGDLEFVEKVEVEDEPTKYLPVKGLLDLNTEYVFECYRAKPIMVVRFDGVEGSPVDFKGITLVNTTPENTTKISVRNAHELNKQITNQHSRAGHGRYYLLKK